MKITLMTQWFEPEPTLKGLIFGKELVIRGNEVEVITGFPNYPGGRVFKGYKIKLLQRENIDGVEVNRVPLYPSHNNSAIKRVANYLSFFFSSLFFGLFKAKKSDVIYAYHPPLTTALSAIIIGKVRNVPVVIDIQDLWPDTLKATGMLNNTFILNLISKVCLYIYKNTQEIVVLSPGFRKKLIDRGVEANKISVIYNWGPEAESDLPINGKKILPKEGFNIVFAGNIGKAQGIETILESANLLLKNNINVNIVFVGDGIQLEFAKEKVNKDGLKNVRFIPRVPMEQVNAILCEADALLVTLIDDELFSITVPSKTQAYLFAGKPIIMGVRGDAADMIKNSNSGITVLPDSPELLFESIKCLTELPKSKLEELGSNGKRYYTEQLSQAQGISNFIRLFEKAIIGFKNR